jgi:hypothetical protein
MLNKRGFFPSVFCINDSSLYVFGGQNELDDLNSCERFNVQENTWRNISPMHKKKNGASLVVLDRVIFIFGGNNIKDGSLNTIERYAIEFDKWSHLKIKLKEPIHDTLAFNLGGGRVMIFGGIKNNTSNTKFEIYDLTCEMLGTEDTFMEMGKLYIPPVYDPSSSILHTFLGYGDLEPKHEKINIQNLLCTCRTVAFTDSAIC